MPVAAKSVGPVAENLSNSTLNITIPALDVGDVVTVSFYYLAASGTPTVPSGWAEAGTQHQDNQVYVRTYWRYASSAEAEHTETFVGPASATGAIAVARVVTGAANAAPTVSSVNNTSSAAYWQTPQIDGAGFRSATAILYAARSGAGTFTTTGTITSTNTLSFHVTALGSFRFAGASYDVTDATAGFVRATLGGGSATSTVRMLQFAEAATGGGGGSLSGTANVVVGVSGNPVNPNAPEPEFPYGPTGLHWPSFTPKPWVDTFTYDVEVAPTWTAIQTALNNAPSSGNAIIRVQPGTLPLGAGAQSGDSFTLQGGYAARTNKILIIPRDGWGTVVGQGSIANKDSSGYKIGLQNVAMMGFDFTNQGVNFCDANYGAIGWSTFGWLQVTQRSQDGNELELIECVLPNQEDMQEDRSAVRVAGGYSINSLLISGCYFAPAYKQNATDAHCDTLQFSGTGGGGVLSAVIRDSAFFQSSSQVIMAEVVSAFDFQQTAVIGGLRGTGRFPIASDRHVMVGENALWGGALSATASNTVVMGSINSNYPWSGVTNSRTSSPAPAGWIDAPEFNGQSTLQTAWINENISNPTPTYLADIWSQLEDDPGSGGPTTHSMSGTTAVVTGTTGNPTKTTRLSGTAPVVTTTTGSPTKTTSLSGTTPVIVGVTGNPIVIAGTGNSLSGSVTVLTTTTGSPTKTTRMSGTVPVTVGTTASPTKTTRMSGTTNVVVTVTGDLRLPAAVIYLSGTINVVTNTTGSPQGVSYTNRQIWELFEYFASQSGLKPRYLFTLQQHEEFFRRRFPSA